LGDAALDIPAFVTEFAAHLRPHLQVDRILLFGSHARGEAGPDSDLDLLVVSPDFGKDYLAEMMLLHRCLPYPDRDAAAQAPGFSHGEKPMR